jgi:LPS O-antigen subunit length determinant protein (WzzB/FepE family)
MNENELMQADDEVSLFDLWEKVQGGWRYVLAGAGLGALVSGLAVVMITPKYEAASTLQIGMIAGKEIEAATTTLERFKSSAFVLEAATQAGVEKLVERISFGDGAGGDYIKAQLVKGTSLVELKTIGDTPESSKKLNDVLVQQLAQRHEVLGAPLKEKLKSDIALTKEKLKSLEIELAELSKISIVSTPKDGQFSPVSLLVSQKIQKQSEVFGLRQQLTNLESMQLAPATQKTQAIELPFAPVKPTSPKKILLVTLGLIGGLLIGLVTVFVRDGWGRSRQAKAKVH